jgi:transposase
MKNKECAQDNERVIGVNELTADDVQAEIRYIGAISIVKSMLDAIEFGNVIERHCPEDERNLLGDSQVIEMLTINLLLSPQAMYKVEEWVKFAGVKDAYGIDPGWLNDDRISRALDHIHPYLNQIKSEVVLRACEKFGISLKHLHWDLTCFTFTGEYEEQLPEFVQILYKKKSSGESPKKCVQVGLDVSVSDGCAVPVWYDLINGNEDEYGPTIKNMENLKKYLKVDKIVRISDKGCFSAKILAETQRQGFHLIAAESFTARYKELYLKALESGRKWEAFSYISQREKKRKDKGLSYQGYRGFEVDYSIGHEGYDYEVRVIFVHSDGKDSRDKKSRKKHMEKIEGIMKNCRSHLGKNYYRTSEQSRERILKRLKKIKESKYLIWSVEGDKISQVLTWDWDESALLAQELFDGVYPLIATVPCGELSTDRVFTNYKEQHYIESCNKNLKRPVRIRPLYVHKQERIESLVFVLFMALLLYCLLQKRLKKIPGYKNRGHFTPREIFWIFSNVSYVKLFIGGISIIKPATLDRLQTHILDQLGVEMHFY